MTPVNSAGSKIFGGLFIWSVCLTAVCCPEQDIDATVLQAAQANLVTAAAQRVLQACKDAGEEPLQEVCYSPVEAATYSFVCFTLKPVLTWLQTASICS